MKAYRIITLLTLILPMSALLIFFYFSSNDGLESLLESPNVVFPSADKRYDYIVDPNDYWSIDATNKTISFHAELMVYEDLEIINGTVKIDYPEFFSMGNKYYAIDENDNVIIFDANKLVKEKMFEMNFLIGMSAFIGIFSIIIIAFMVMKKMKILSRHRRLSVLISSAVFTMFFLILSMITSQIYLMFLVFTLSWGAYYIEWLIYRKKNELPLHDQISQRVVITNE